MSITLIDHVGSAGAPNGSDTSGNSRTTDSSAKLIVIHVAYDGASNFTQTPFDSKSNIYTSRQRQRDNDNVSHIYDCVNPTTGSGHYFSISAAGSYSSLQAAWFSGTDTTPFDATNGSTSTGSTAPTLSVTPGQPGELIVAGLATDGGSSFSATSTSGNTFTVTDSNAFASATCYGAALAYTIQTGSAVAESVTWSGTSSLNAATIATYKAASTGTTLALTGTAATGSVGTLAPSISRALTGNAATGATGTLTAAVAGALSGTTATGAPGTLTGAVAYALTGIAATASPGTLANAVAYALTGTQATGSAGSVGAQGSVTIALSGVAATAALGTLAPAISSALTGIAGAGALGSMPNVVTYGLTANAATGAAGSLVAVGDITAALTGVQAAGAVGTLSASGGDTAAWRATGPRSDRGTTPRRGANLSTGRRTP